jgi:hypothetical protein
LSTESKLFRASQAQDLLDNRMLREIFAEQEKEAIRRMIDAAPEDEDTRRYMSERVKAIREVETILRHVLMERKTEEMKEKTQGNRP